MKKCLALLALLLLPLLATGVYAIPINWGANIPIDLMSNSTAVVNVQSSQLWTFNGFPFVNNSLVFSDTYIGSGSMINSLGISSNVNVTLNQLSLAGENSLTAYGSGLAQIQLKGYGQAPDSVESATNQTVPYLYSSSNDILTLSPTISGDSITILFDYPQSSANTAMAIGIVFGLIAFSIGAIALIFALRARREKESENSNTTYD